MIRCLLAGLVFAVACGACPLRASAQPSTTVQEAPSTVISSLTELPADLKEVLGAEGMADRGEPFNPSCVTQLGEATSRFVSGSLEANRALILVERGGRAHWVETMEFAKVARIWRLERRGPGNANVRSIYPVRQTSGDSLFPPRKAAGAGF